MLIDIVRCRRERCIGLICNVCTGRLCSGSSCSKIHVPCAAHTLAYCTQVHSHVYGNLRTCHPVRSELKRIRNGRLVGYGYRSACCRYGQRVVGDIRSSERMSVACSFKRVEEVGLCACITVVDPYLIRRCSCSSCLSLRSCSTCLSLRSCISCIALRTLLPCVAFVALWQYKVQHL